MRDWLLRLEKESDIEILFACEAGSRVWGLETSQSDFDIRFIYRYRDIKKYLSLRKAREVMEFNTPYDVVGFDVYKAFALILKSNPSLYEWAFSPIIYVEKKQFADHLKELIETSYSPLSLCKHYSSLTKRNIKELVNHNYTFKKQKQLLQAVRAELIRSSIIKTKKISSPFACIENARRYSPKLSSAYTKLIEAKRQHILLSIAEVIENTRLLTISLSQDDSNLPVHDPSAEAVESWLWDLLDVT